MTCFNLNDLEARVQDRSAFNNLTDYMTLCSTFLTFVERTNPTRIISPTHHNYIFYQYDETHDHKITRPLNVDLFIEKTQDFHSAFERFAAFLDDLKKYQELPIDMQANIQYFKSN